MLKFRVVGQRLIWENPDEVIVAGTKKYLECYFEFDGDAWRGYEHIDAYFKNGRDNPIRMVLSANRIWREDELCLSAGEWSLYLGATEYITETNEDGSTENIVDRQITSSAVTIKVLANGQMTNAQNSFESPEIADQYIAQMLVFENARTAAENARAEAETGRASAESARASAEAKRADAEDARVSAEGLRVSAEDARAASEARREQAMRELIEDVAGAVGCKVFDIDMAQYGFGDSEVGETYYLDSGIGIPNVRLGDFVFDTVAGYIYKCIRKAEADAIVGDGYLCVSALGGGGSSGGDGGFRKIGFTEDCDFVATTEDGLTAFRNAINAATDGETFLVMPGTYVGAAQLDVTKDINFVGIGMPRIEFPVWISGCGVFNYENWAWDVLYPNVKSCWCGFAFLNSFMVGHECNPDNVGYAGYADLKNCTVEGEYVGIRGEARSCAFRCNNFSVGHYYDYGAGAIFEDCTISATNYFEVYEGDFDSCEIYPSTPLSYHYYTNSISSSTFTRCKIHAVGTSVNVSDSRGSGSSFGQSLVFADSTDYGGYLVTPVAK